MLCAAARRGNIDLDEILVGLTLTPEILYLSLTQIFKLQHVSIVIFGELNMVDTNIGELWVTRSVLQPYSTLTAPRV